MSKNANFRIFKLKIQPEPLTYNNVQIQIKYIFENFEEFLRLYELMNGGSYRPFLRLEVLIPNIL